MRHPGRKSAIGGWRAGTQETGRGPWTHRVPTPVPWVPERPCGPSGMTMNLVVEPGRKPGPALLPRHLRFADAVTVQDLVVVHGDGHLAQGPGEAEGRGVVGDRAAAVAADI